MTLAHYPEAFFACKPAAPGTERFDVLYEHRGVIIERIASSGSQPAKSYCQSQDEWVLLLRGNAEMRVAGQTVVLREGDYVRIPAHTPHEVCSTSEDALWLAVHVQAH
jgi:cupin 2 domain-containing protein